MKKEIIKPFDLEAYKNGAKVKTREGNEVRIICTDRKNPHCPIIALVKVDDINETVLHYTPEGKVLLNPGVISGDDLVIVEEVEEPEFWSDKKNKVANGYFIGLESNIVYHTYTQYNHIEQKFFATKKQAKSALAMARISQIMANDIENFGGAVTDEEWKNNKWKHIIYRNGCCISTTAIMNDYYFLAFHTPKQRGLFLKKYYDLVKDFLMID
jgi:hypothetical protein